MKFWDEGRSDQRDSLFNFLGIDDGDPLKTELTVLRPLFSVRDSGYFSGYIDFADTHFQTKIIVFTTNCFG